MATLGIRALSEISRLATQLTELNLETDRGAEEAARLVVATAQRSLGVPCRLEERPPLGCDCQAVPVRVGGREVAWLVATRTAPLPESDRLVLEACAGQAGLVMGFGRWPGRRQRGLARQEEELSRLRASGLLIASRLSLEETLQAILSMALEVTGARYGIFRLLDRSRHRLVTRAIAGERLARPLVEALEIAPNSITGWVAHHRQSLCISDLHEPPWNELYYPLDQALQMRSELAVPLLGPGNRLEGVLNLESPEVGAFQDDDRLLLQALASQAVIAIGQVRLLDALQRIAEHLLSWSCQQVLDHLVDQAVDLLNASGAALYCLEGEVLHYRAGHQGPPPGRSIPVQGSLTGSAITARHPVVCARLHSEPSFEWTGLARDYGWHRALIVPILAGPPLVAPGHPCGALCLYTPHLDAEASLEWDTKVLVCLAHHAGLALQAAAREAQLRSSQEQRALAETFAALGDLSANMLHQINNKVGTIPVRIQGIWDRSSEALSGDAYLTRNLQEIERSAQSALQAVRDNLQLLDPKPTGSHRLLDCVRRAVAEAGPGAHIKVKLSGLRDLPPVVAGDRGLVLIFTNLIENAAREMPEGGTITIQARPNPEAIEVDVRDTGPGIDPDLAERLFELRATGRGPVGLGFGLWWVRTLMGRLGGSIELVAGRRKGSCFRLRFPLAEPR